jgi:hypothetical protein
LNDKSAFGYDNNVSTEKYVHFSDDRHVICSGCAYGYDEDGG